MKTKNAKPVKRSSMPKRAVSPSYEEPMRPKMPNSTDQKKMIDGKMKGNKK